MIDSTLAAWQERIQASMAARSPLLIRGGGTKDFYGESPRGEVLDTRAYAGIVDYEPTELVITARAGTPLRDVEQAMAERGQMLAFEPPHFGARRDARRRDRGGTVRAAPALCRRGARSRARHPDPRRRAATT